MSTNVTTSCTYEGTTRGDTFRFHSFISHLIEYIEVVKSSKGFWPNALLSKLIAILLDFRPILEYILAVSKTAV
jgi:hypothetical protein